MAYFISGLKTYLETLVLQQARFFFFIQKRIIAQFEKVFKFQMYTANVI
jgi:hypothetical protein